MSLNSGPFHHPSGNAGLTLSDFSVVYAYPAALPFAPVALTGVLLEDLATTKGNGWYRLTGLPDPPDYGAAELLVAASTDPDTLLLEQGWDAQPDVAILTELEALFSPLPGNVPITILLNDATSALPISGATVSIWNADSSQVVIPKLTTSVAGKVVMSLPPGTYQAYFFKPFAVFPALPVDFTVVTGPATTFTYTGTDGMTPIVPTIPQVTIYGHVMYPNGTVAQSVEVKMRLRKSPQMSSTAGFTKASVSAMTDADGYFEISCAGGLEVVLECETVGYSRQGKLPNSGSINWREFSVALIP